MARSIYSDAFLLALVQYIRAYRLAFVTEGNEKLSMADNTLSLRRERTEEINTNAFLYLGFKDMEVIDKQRGGDKASGSIGAKENSGSNHYEHFSTAERVEAHTSGELEINETENQSNPCPLGGDGSARVNQNNGSSAYLVYTSESHGQETGSIKQIDTNKEILIPKNSIPHWTEEQLDELLSFD